MTSNLFFNIKLSKKDLLKGLKLPLEINEDLAYLCGIIIGDGSIYKRIEKAHILFRRIADINSEAGLEEIAARYLKHKEEIAPLFPEILRS